MGQKWTPEQKQAARDRYQAKAAQKQKTLETNSPPTGTELPPIINHVDQQDPMSGPQPESAPQMTNPDYGDIERRIDEMVQAKLRALGVLPGPSTSFQPWQNMPQPMGGLQIGSQGQLVGTREKYVLDPKRYPDPRSRLADEQPLERFAFKQNYDMEWEVGVSSYQTKDGVNTREPKFTLKLRRIVFDDDTGLPTDQRYVICQAIFHEDPDAALVIAQEKGYTVDTENELNFLNEMRYLRMRDWLMEAFYPPKPKLENKKREAVVGNRVVEIFTVNGTETQAIPFDQIKRATV
jgi:hypothetical protein